MALFLFCDNDAITSYDILGLLRKYLEFAFDKKRCRLDVTLNHAVRFVSGPWSRKEKREWKSRAKDRIENYFNGLSMRCYSDCGDTCPEGVSIRLNANFQETQSSSVAQTDVHYDRVGRSHEGKVDRFDPVDNDGRTIIHEAGHWLRMMHPGQFLDPKEELGSLRDYEADPGDIMGAGWEMRERNFNKAFCEQIPTNGDKQCTRWYAIER